VDRSFPTLKLTRPEKKPFTAVVPVGLPRLLACTARPIKKPAGHPEGTRPATGSVGRGLIACRPFCLSQNYCVHYCVQQLPHPLGALAVLQQLVASATSLPEQQEQSVQIHTAPWQHPQHWQVWQPHEPLATTGVVGARARAAQSRKLVMGKFLGKSENK